MYYSISYCSHVMKHFQGIDKTLWTQAPHNSVAVILIGENAISNLTLYVNDIDTAAVCRHQNLHREDIAPLTAYVISSSTVVIAVLIHWTTV